ncbi:TolC family outer membrane protein [Roseivivax sp. CAU 1761]
MGWRHWIASGCTAGLLAVGATAQADTLADALTGAYLESGLLEQNRAVLRAADEDVAQAVAALRPVFAWSADATRRFGETRSNGVLAPIASNDAGVNLTADLTVYDFGERRLQIDAAKAAVLSARQQLVSVEQEVLLRAVDAFFEVERAAQTVQLRRSNLRLISQELQAARDRFEVGEVTRTDVALAEARLAQARSQLAVAEGNLVLAQEEYRAVVGRLPNGVSPPRSLPALPTAEQAAASALRLHPSIVAQQHQVRLAELNVLIAEAAMKPDVTLSGRYGYNRNLDSTDFSRSGTISLGMSGPIYQGGRLSSLVRQAMAQRDRQRGVLLTVTRQVAQNVANAYVALSVARSSIQSSQNQVRAAQVAFDGVREEATLGARTTLDVLDAEQDLLDARTTLISAQVDQYVAAYTALAAMGRLTVVDLDLPVQRYNPSDYYNLVKDAPRLSRQGEDLERVLRAIGKQ